MGAGPGHRPPRRKVLAVASLMCLVVGAAPLGLTPAAAAVSCTYAGGSKTATVTMGAGDSATIVVASGNIAVNGTACSVLANTEHVIVGGASGSESVTIDLGGGPFDNGVTDVSFDLVMGPNGSAGDSLTIAGASTADNIVFGAAGIDLTNDGTADVTPSGVENFAVNAAAGNDTVTGAGGGGTGAAFADPLVLNGNAGNDALTGGTGNDTFVSSPDNDTMNGGTGINTADYSGDPAGVTVDLTAGTATDGFAGTDALANIQNVQGSAFADTLTGSAAANVLNGAGGADTVNGADGADTLNGGGGGDTLNGGTGADSLNGGAGDDTLNGGDDNDSLDGGPGNDGMNGNAGSDTVDYTAAPAGVSVDLTAGTATDGTGGNDTLAGIETVLGSDFADTLHGAASGTDTLFGENGNDTLVSGAADDTMNGNNGVNTVSYADAAAAVTVDLPSETGGGSASGTDPIHEIQNITGSAHNDTLTGDSGDNRISGGNGNDVETGGLGNDTFSEGSARNGSDVMSGGAGVDTVLYSRRTGVVTVNLSTATSTNGALGEGDTIQTDVENAFGGSGADTLVGNTSNNSLSGQRGADVIRGRAGNDRLFGGRGKDFLAGGPGNDLMNGGLGNDTCRDTVGVNHRISC